MRTFLGLGSNIGNRREFLTEAIQKLPDVKRVSPLYETSPVGGPENQESYLNCVVELETDLSPRELLNQCLAIEANAGRERRERWAPRTLDIDILLMGDLEINENDLQIPHPRMKERRFVMAPLGDLAPELVPTGWESNVIGDVRQVEPIDWTER